MFLNSILSLLQNKLSPIYQKSYVLKNIDWLIFVSIILTILLSGCLSSDAIGYFALFSIFLTFIKILFKPNEKFILTNSDKFLLIYFLLVIISVAGSSLFLLSLKGFLKTCIYLGFYISFIHYLKDNRDKLKYILLAISLVVVGESFIAIKQNFLSVPEISSWQDMSRLNPEQVMTRVYGSLKPYNPNLFGGYMLAALPAVLTLLFIPLINKHKKTALVGLIFFILAAIAIILTGCRGAYIGLFAEIITFLILTYKFLKPTYKKIFLYLASIFSFMSFIIISLTSSLRARVISIFAMRADSSNSFRFNVYNSCLEMFKDNWLLGIGVGNQNFREIYGLYMKTGFDALSAYNIYLETALESGIFALLAFLCFIVFNLYRAIKYIYKRNNIKAIYLAIAVMSITGILIHGLVDTVFFRPQIQFIFWIMMGIIRVYTSSWGKNGIKRKN